MLIVIMLLFLPSIHVLKCFFGNYGIWIILLFVFFARGIVLWSMSGKAIINKDFI